MHVRIVRRRKVRPYIKASNKGTHRGSTHLVLQNPLGFCQSGFSFSRNLRSKFCAILVVQLRKPYHQETVVAAIVKCSAMILWRGGVSSVRFPVPPSYIIFFFLFLFLPVVMQWLHLKLFCVVMPA